jgi:nucleolar complex protein 3
MKTKWRKRKLSEREERVEAKLTSDDDLSHTDLEDGVEDCSFLLTADLNMNKHHLPHKPKLTDYETVPRISKEYAHKLPIKIDGRLIISKPISIVKQKKQTLPSNPVNEPKPKVIKEIIHPVISVKKETVNEIKEKLALHASLLIEDPEMNISHLRHLREFCSDKRPQIIILTLLTQLAVFKDIIPGYRIRKTDDNDSQSLSKEVKRLRNYEETLLSNYQVYLQTLEDIAQGSFYINLDNYEGNIDLLRVAVKCMTELLGSVSHFNFRINLLTAVVSKMANRKNAEVLFTEFLDYSNV